MNLELGFMSAKGFIAFLGLFHTAVASLAIGLAFMVTFAELVGYRYRIRRHDLFAKRTQLFHVCIYNIGTINAIGLVFALSGLFPQFWEQFFVHFHWVMIVEEFIFFLLATTITFHYFFWDYVWGHKKLHLFLGALLTPLFFFQFYFINAVGSFMLTPGNFQEGTLSLSVGVLGWDRLGFFNPSFMMLQLHRVFANISSGGFFIAGWCGIRLYFHSADPVKKAYYEDNGRLSFYVAFMSFLALPIVGFFYSAVLMRNADEAFWNLMMGRGDVVKAGIDLWWLKHLFVAAMVGGGLGYFSRKAAALASGERFSVPNALIYAVAVFYFIYYLCMGLIMTWAFFLWSLAFAVGGYLLSRHMVNYGKGSSRAPFLMMGLLSFGTVMLGGWSREAARPRFDENRHSAYDKLYIPAERQPYLMVDLQPPELTDSPAGAPVAVVAPPNAASLIAGRCVGCNDLQRVRNYRGDDWPKVVNTMVVYGTKLDEEEKRLVVEHLSAGLSF